MENLSYQLKIYFMSWIFFLRNAFFLGIRFLLAALYEQPDGCDFLPNQRNLTAFVKLNKQKERASRENGIKSRKNSVKDLTIQKLYQGAYLSVVQFFGPLIISNSF